MAIVTGDRYLDFLVRFVERNAGPLLEGTLTLKLNPVGLHYVQSRLEALKELEGLLAGAPVDYLRAYVSDLGDHRALEQLRRILRLLTSLKVISVLPPPSRDPTPLSLLPFGRLKVLELRGCDLSTSAARGLLELRHTLEKLICQNSTDALRHVFASRIADIRDSPVWKRLSFVSCTCNGLILMDESLQLLPAVETLDLSRNRFAKVDNLRKCTKLEHLDLGLNHLRTVASLSEASCPIIKLILRNNALTTLRGIENLKSVEGLDLSYNIISTFSELEILASLPSLQNLWLEGNPISCARWYRAHVFSFFSHPEKLKLDEKGINTREYWERHIVLASRQQRPAGYGFYFPAKGDAKDGGSSSTKKKKPSRLACIEDEERRRYSCSEAVDQESLSCDSDNLKKDENAISDGEAEITDLMNRAEIMKKERSVLWLREFRDWMDQTSKKTVDADKLMESNLDGQEKCSKQRACKHLGENPLHEMDQKQTSGNESSRNFLESDASFPGIYVCTHGHEYLDSNGKDGLECSTMDESQDSRTRLKIERVGLKQDQLEPSSKELLDPHSLNAEYSFPSTILTVKEGDQIDLTSNSAPLTAIEEIMVSRSSSLCPGSPPHYQEDILHRRQNLEEEFLQLSIDSYSVASSDSDTSCSDDDSCRFGNSFVGIDWLWNEESRKQSSDNHSSEFILEENNQDKRYMCEFPREHAGLFSGALSGPASLCGEILKPNHLTQFSSSDMTVAGSVDQDAEYLGKRKHKQNPKRRTIKLAEENCVAEDTDFQELNGILDVDTGGTNNGYVLPSCNENGHLKSQEEPNNGLTRNHNVNSPPIDSAHSVSLEPKHCSTSPHLDEFIENYFHLHVADFSVSENIKEYIHCYCILEEGSGFQEREVAVLLSSKEKVYILLIDAQEGPGINCKVLGCHRLDDIKEAVVGLGLQSVRMQVEDDASYLFLTRTSGKLKGLLHLLQVCDSCALSSTCNVRSWEQVQVELFEKHVCKGLKMSIFLYSMLLFWHDKCEGESWLSRSLFVVEGHVLVCFENLVQFSSLTDDYGVSCPYFSLDSCCPIQNILEMVIEPKESRCLTLTLDHVISRKNCFHEKSEKDKQCEEKGVHELTWRLKWFSEETLLKFVALVKAIHAGFTTSSLPVKCIS